jgi:sterol desaturase/sphingolipid hydroxylase (fatty acid hydroxylase superfamily)
MIETLAEHEPALRLGAFAGVFVLVALWEARAPRRAGRFGRRDRWPHNLGLLALDALLVRLLAPGAAIAVALAAERQGWGLLNLPNLPAWARVLAAVIALDLAIYLQHVLFHAVPALWRLHRVHHADPDFDVTTGTRFHPLEIVLSLALKCAAVAALGAPALAVLIFEVLLNATAMFNHANARLPVALDRRLRWLVVTPDMHRVHHSVEAREMNSNFGFSLPWWDRLFGTYRAQPGAGHVAMQIGIAGLQGRDELALPRLLTQPLRRPQPLLGPASRFLGHDPRAEQDSGGAGIDRPTAIERGGS